MNTLAVHSSKGGSGKTFLAANMGKAFALAGKKCVIVDCDISGPSFNMIIPPETESKSYSNDILLGKASVSEAICKTIIKNLDIIFANPNPILGEGLLSFEHSTHVNALRNLSNARNDLYNQKYDVLLLDTTPGLNPLSVNTLLIAQQVVIVVRPDSYSLQITNHILHTLYKKLKDSAVGSKKYFIVFNQVPYAPDGDIETILALYEKEISKNLDIDVLGHIHCLCKDIGADLLRTPLLDEGKPGMDTILTITEKLLGT